MRRRQSKVSLRALVERRAQGRCDYCHAPQRFCGYRFHLEHINPRSQGGSNESHNRALACASCNLAKSDRVTGVDPLTGEEVPLFDPRKQMWEEHFRWAEDQQTLEGLTPVGRATVATLDMNGELRQEARRLWFERGLLP